jgi:hypothetical protein
LPNNHESQAAAAIEFGWTLSATRFDGAVRFESSETFGYVSGPRGAPQMSPGRRAEPRKPPYDR